MTVLPTSSRLEWMDALRGFAIILVLVWHAPAIPALFGYEMPTWLESVNDFFLPFRMPTLMFLSGLLLSRSISKGWRVYYAGKLRSLLWPYLLWAALHIILYGRGLELTNPRSWIATGYLWFLFYIASYYLIAPLISPVPPWIILLVMLGASIPLDDGLYKKFFYFGTFFFAGNLAMTHRAIFEKLTKPNVAGYFAVGAVGFGVLSAFMGDRLVYRGEFAVFSLMGIIVAISLTKRSANAAWLAHITSIGRNSLIYYVSHFPIILIWLHALKGFGIESIWAIAIPGLVLALVIGGLLAKYRFVVPIRWLFQAPSITARKPPEVKTTAS